MSSVSDALAVVQPDVAPQSMQAAFAHDFASAPLLVFEQDAQLRYVRIKPSPSSLAPESLGKTDGDLYTPETARTLSALKQVVLANGVELRVQMELNLNGANGVYDVLLQPLRDPTGATVGLSGALSDISARKLAEDALRESEERFTRMFETSPYGAVLFDLEHNGAIVECNTAWQNITGWSRAEAVGKTGAELGLYETNAMREAIHEPLQYSSYLRDYETEMVRKDGTRRTVSLSAEPISLRGKMYFIGSVQDLGERKQIEQALRVSEDRLQLAVSAGGIGIWDIDLRNGVRRWSEQGKAIYGLGAAEAMDYERQLSLIHPDDRAWVHDSVTAFRDQGTVSHLELEHRIIRPDGSLRWVAVRGQAIYDGQALPARLVGTIIDITDRKWRELHAQFLLSLNESIAHLSDAREVMRVSVEQVARHLEVSGCQFAEYERAKDEATVILDWTGDQGTLAGGYRLSEFAADDAINLLSAGNQVVVKDAAADYATAQAYEKFVPLGARAFVLAPYLSDGRCKAWVSVHDRAPRQWRVDELDLLRDIANLAWTRIERLRAEAALRESEERFSKAFSASPMILTISSLRTGKLVAVNDAFVALSGYTREETLGRTPIELGIWKNPRDREAGLDAIHSGGHVRWFETKFNVKAGERIALISGERIEIGGEPFVLSVMEDITERKRHEQAQRILTEAGALLSSSLDYERTLKNVAQLIVPEFADYCMVLLEQGGLLKQVAAAHRDAALQGELERLAEHYIANADDVTSLVAGVLRTGETVLMRRVPPVSRELAGRYSEAERIVKMLAAESFVLTPMRTRSRTMGVMTFNYAQSGRRYDEADVPFLQALTERAALAIENAQLYAAEQQERAAAERAQRRSELLAEASRVLNASLDYQTTLENVVRLMLPDFADYSGVWLFTPDGPRHAAAAHVDPQMEALLRRFDQIYVPDTEHPSGPVSRVLASGQTQFLPQGDLAAVEAMPDGEPRRVLQMLAARSIIIAPLRVHERHLGVISFVLSVSGRTYVEADVSFAEEVALRAAAAIENARLYQQTQSLNAELEARVAERTREWRQASEELRELAGHLQSTREEERASIARELHDELGQLLTVIKIDVSQLAKRFANDPHLQNGSLPNAIAQLQAVQQMLDDGVRSIRALVANLRPQILDDLGLRAALEWQVQQFQERTGIEAQFTTNVERLSWNHEREMALFRILQESLNNVAHHAGATRVAVELRQDVNALTLEVRDNGHGIRRDAILKENHFGILGMRERAILLGGGIIIDGAPGEGTQVVVRVPQP